MSAREHCNHHPTDCDGAACAGVMVRDALARELVEALDVTYSIQLADAILASDWLAKHDAEVGAKALRDAAVALEAERLTSPFNGDGSNYMLDKVMRRLDAVAGDDGPSKAAEMERARREDERDVRYCAMHGMDLPPQTHVDRLRIARATTTTEVGT